MMQETMQVQNFMSIYLASISNTMYKVSDVESVESVEC